MSVRRILLSTVLMAIVLPSPARSDDRVVVYSSRTEALIKPLFDEYTQETGIAVQYLTGDASALIERIAREGDLTEADVLLTVDAGMLWLAAERGLLAELQSRTLEYNVPENLRDPGKRWFGLTRRARIIAHSTERVDAGQLDSYAGLADPQWKGRLCLTSGKEIYNVSLVAVLIDRFGKQRTKEIVAGWLNNLASQPFATDTGVLQAIEAGQCDVGIVNSYYFGRMQYNDPDVPVTIFWPDQQGGGVHENISGGAVTAAAPRPELGLDLLEWLSTKPAQVEFAGLNLEYPVNPKVHPVRLVARWGQYKSDAASIARVGPLQSEAIQLMLEAGYQ